MLLDCAAAVGRKQARKIVDALQKRLSDIRVDGTRGERAIYLCNEAQRNGARLRTTGV